LSSLNSFSLDAWAMSSATSAGRSTLDSCNPKYLWKDAAEIVYEGMTTLLPSEDHGAELDVQE